MGKFERHCVVPQEFKVKNEKGEEDVFTIKALPWEHVADLFEIMAAMGDMDFKEVKEMDQEAAGREFIKHFKGDTLKSIQTVVLATLTQSYPEESKETLQSFGIAHLWELFPFILDMNMSGMDEGTIKAMQKKADDKKQA